MPRHRLSCFFYSPEDGQHRLTEQQREALDQRDLDQLPTEIESIESRIAGLQAAIDREIERIDYPRIPVGVDPDTGGRIVLRIGRTYVYVEVEGEDGEQLKTSQYHENRENDMGAPLQLGVVPDRADRTGAATGCRG